MTDQNFTAIAVLMDRSGSMQLIKTDAEGALNSFVEEQRKVDGKATLRLSQFDNEYETVFESVDLADVKPITLQPRGSTALNDGIGHLVTDFGAELAAMPEDERPGKVLVVIVTDGHENSSREWSVNTVRDLVEAQRDKYGWEFVFLAAGQDAVLTGQSYGFSAGSSLTFDTANIGTTSSMLSTYTTTYRGAGKASFSDEDRAAAVDNS